MHFCSPIFDLPPDRSSNGMSQDSIMSLDHGPHMEIPQNGELEVVGQVTFNTDPPCSPNSNLAATLDAVSEEAPVVEEAPVSEDTGVGEEAVVCPGSHRA